MNPAHQKKFDNILKKLIKNFFLEQSNHLPEIAEKNSPGIKKIKSGLGTPNSILLYRSHSPWQKGATKNTNGLLRENFPKKTNFSTVTQRDLYWKGVYRINNRPRKVLGWKTAQECFAEELRNSA